MLRQIIGAGRSDPPPLGIVSRITALPPPLPTAPAEETDFYESPARPMARAAATMPMPMTAARSVLSDDVEIRGTITFAEDLILDGKIIGDIHSNGSLTVGENGVIAGEINTRSVTVFGRVEGNVTVQERCELKTNCRLTGDISAGTLAIEEGSTFQGRSAVGRR